MKRASELICIWGGVAFSVLFGVGFLGVAGFVPPLSPADTAQETAAIFRDNDVSIRAGLLLCNVGAMFFLAFGAAIAGQTRRIRGVAPTVVYLQVGGFSAGLILIVMPFFMWFAAAYRADTWSAESIQLLDDLGWISFLAGFPPFVMWFIGTGMAILSDIAEVPLFPRWAGWLAIFLGSAQSTAMMLVFFRTGPFAWDGVFAWWLPATEFFTWFIVITVLMLKAVGSDYEARVDARVAPGEAGLSEVAPC